MQWEPFTSADGADRVDAIVAKLGDAKLLRRLFFSAHEQAVHDELHPSELDQCREPIGPRVDDEAMKLQSSFGRVPTFRISCLNYDPLCAASAMERGEGEQAALLVDEAGDASGLLDAAWYRLPEQRTRLNEAVEDAMGWKLLLTKGADVILVVEIAPPSEAHHWPFGAFSVSSRKGRGMRRRPRRGRGRVPASAGDANWFASFRAETLVSYDTLKYPFAHLLAELLEVSVDAGVELAPTGLAKLHDRPLTKRPLYHKLAQAFVIAGYDVPRAWRQYDGSTVAEREGSDAWRGFLQAFRTFVQEVCAPLCGAHGGLVFQCPPTVRIALPGAPATIRMHCDADYPKHQHGEVNFWLPVTMVSGSNTLWLESKPGEGDFRPMELGFGQLLRFNGYECRHYTVPNETPFTRVSFDWRAVPVELWRGGHPGVFGDYPAERTTPT